MDFSDFNMNDYFRTLEEFKSTHTDEIVSKFGSTKCFDEIISEMKTHDEEIADLAVKQYGSIENYTIAMKKNLHNYLSGEPGISKDEVDSLIEKTEAITKRLTSDLNIDVKSANVQKTVCELINFVNKCNGTIDMGENYWPSMAEAYMSNPIFIQSTDKKYGAGASNFIGLALRAYLEDFK